MQSFQLKSCQAYLVPNEKIIELSSSPTSRECPMLEFSIFKQKEPHQLIGNSKTEGNQTALPLSLQKYWLLWEGNLLLCNKLWLYCTNRRLLLESSFNQQQIMKIVQAQTRNFSWKVCLISKN